MTLGGWITMSLSVGFVTAFFTWAILRVLRAPEAEERLHTELDIDTRDQNSWPPEGGERD